MAAPVLLFVPLDDRPVTVNIVVDLGRAAGVDVRTPDRSMLGGRFRPGDADRVWEWLEREATGGAAAVIASVEMLCFGGLVASRKSEEEFAQVAPRLRRLYALAARVPAYISAVLPRTPVQPTDEDAPYWAPYGDALRRATQVVVARRPPAMFGAGSGPMAQSPTVSPIAASLEAIDAALQLADLPRAVSSAVRRDRGRQLQLNADLIGATGEGTLRYLLIGQDDTAPGSLSQIEREALQAQTAALGAANVLLSSGTDELNARLFARWLNDLTGAAPSVRVLYTYPDTIEQVPRYEGFPLRQTVDEHLRSAGCRRNGDGPDVLLWVHNFEDRQQEAVNQTGTLDPEKIEIALNAVREAARKERVVALADVRFANGADRALVARLLDEPRFGGIVAYAGWNTCSNSLGSLMAYATVAYHLRAGTVPGDDRIYRHAFFTRILDDWGYQSLVRPQLTRWLEERGGSSLDLEGYEAEAEVRALEGLRGEAVHALQRSFVYHPPTLRRATFPWHRLFEIQPEVDVAVARGGRGIVVADYDPRWAQMYETEKGAIRRALAPLVRGIEHVGSTAVPGLAAKPIVDIVLGVDEDDLDTIIEPLVAIGYEYNPDWEISMPMRRYFRRFTAGGLRTHHVHAVPYGGDFWTRHVAFRDYLRAHPEKAREYGELKKQLARQHPTSIDYTFAKTEFIRSVEALAGFPYHRAGRPRPGTT